MEHFILVTAETPLPSKRLVIRSQRPLSSQTEAFFFKNSRPETSVQRFFENHIFTVDLALDRVGNRDHSLIVVEYPTDLAAL